MSRRHASTHLAGLLLLVSGACSSSAGTGPGDGGSGGSAQSGSGGSGGTQVGGSGGGGTGGQGDAGAAGGGSGGTAGGSDSGASDGGSAGADGGLLTDARDTPAVSDGLLAGDVGKLEECSSPSIDRVQIWVATQGEGNMVPSGGSILVKEGDHYVGKIEFIGTGWHVVPVYPTNTQGGGQVDFSKSAGFTLTYSATSDLWVQMRPANHWSGGTQFGTKIPSTGGVTQSTFFPFAKESWGRIPGLGLPTWPYEETLMQVRGFVFVGNLPNTIVFSGLRFDNYVPVCRP